MQETVNQSANVEIIKSEFSMNATRTTESSSILAFDAGDNKAIMPPYNPDDLSQYYQSNSYHQRCVQTKALVTAGLGFDFISKDTPPAAEENVNLNNAEDEQYTAIMNFIKENEETTGETFIEMLIKFQTDFEVFGYAFIEVVRNLTGNVTHLYHIPAKNAALVKNENNGSIELMQTINSKTQKFCKNEFLMIKNYNPDNRYYGLPEYVSCLPAILFDREMMEYNIARIQNNAIPDLIVTVSGTQLTQAQKDTMKDFWSGNFKGIKNSGKTLLIETNAKDSQIQVTEIKSTYRDGAFRLAKRECRDEIIACHGVPPVLLGIKTSGTIGSGKDITEQVRTFKEIIIEPRQRRLEHLFNSFFCKELAIDKIEILFKNINLIELINGKENK